MFIRYELHNHTDQSDANLTCRELVDVMEADGVDCFAITDHNTVSGHRIIQKILAEGKHRVRCIYGMEYTTYYGHIVCPVLETYVPWDSIDRRRPELLFSACKKAGAVTGVAHPFSYGDPFARGCRFDMEITDFTDVDYIEIVNSPEPLREVNEPGLLWWEDLVLRGEKLAACAGMDLHNADDMSMKFATYIEGTEDGDPAEELRAAVGARRTWVSKGMLLLWEADGGTIRFSLFDAKKHGYETPEKYVLTLKGVKDTLRYEMPRDGVLTLPREVMDGIRIPKLYGGEPEIENLICVSPTIPAAADA